MTVVTIKLHWFLPTYGDSRSIVGGGHGTPVGAAHSDREASIDYLASIVRSAETFGFTGALIPTGAWCEDAFITAALLARETSTLAFLVAFRPGLVSPTLSAQMAATFARHAPGRILLNVVVGGEAHEQRAFGDYLDKDGRYERADEFLDVVRRLWAGQTVSASGNYITVDQASLALPRIRCRRCTSAAAHRPPDRWPPGTPTSTSPGVSRRRRSGRRSPGSRRSASGRAASCASASACTPSPGTPRPRPGRRPTA